MKIKKFNNLWAMGLILLGVILVALYVIKIFFPEYIIGVAQHESVVAFGEYVDSHSWAYYLFTFVTCIIIAYFFCCASCRKKYLCWRDLIIVTIETILMMVAQKLLPQYYLYINVIGMLGCPTLICFLDKQLDIKYLYSIIYLIL